MDFLLLKIFLTIFSFSACSGQVSNLTVPCPFNSLCKCTAFSSSNRGFIPHYKALEVFNEVSCNEVPFTKLPGIRSQNMTKLNILGSGLQILEDWSLGDMKLKSLNLANNKLMIVSSKALYPSNQTLEALDLSYNNFQVIPSEMINSLINLKILSLESNEIYSLKTDWGNLKKTLQSLFLGKNDISFLHLNFNFTLSNFQNLILINLDHNYLTNLDENSMPFSLKSLSLEHNLLDAFPSELIDNLRHLQKLSLKDNYIKNLPNYVFKTRSPLMSLDLSNNLLTTINDILGRTIKIDDLDLSYNDIGSIVSKSFNGLSCSKLDLSHNKITSLSEKAFYGLTYTLENIDLAHNSLTRFPKALIRMKKLKTLSLRHNYISSLSDSSLKNSSGSLTTLSLSQNNFHSIPKYSLRNLKKVQSISFAYNKINNIYSSDFSHWGDKLQTLSLGSNRFTYLENNAFKNLPRLFTLRLPYNSLNEISEKAFNNLNLLQSLDLGYSIKNLSFPEKSIKQLPNLRDLFLDNNRIKKLPDRGLMHFRLLSTINLEFNRINFIPETFFRKNYHGNLADIRLSFNKLKNIETGAFTDLKSLKFLTISHNEISSIGPEAFKNLPSKIIIILSHNRLINIANRTFMNIPNLMELDLHNNDLKSINWHMFENVSDTLNPMTLNLSHNLIENMPFELTSRISWQPQLIASKIHVEKLDLSHNKFEVVPYESLRAINSSLKVLDLGYNYIKTLHNNPFMYLSNLEILNLEHNELEDIKGSKFQLYKLQILDLSHNHISSLLIDHFSYLRELRVLDLSYNYLSSLPGEVFRETKLERLILKSNQFVTVPSQALVPIGHTLGVMDLSNNRIQNMDADQFTNAPLLTDLNLCFNSFSQIQSPVFRNLNFLLNLELCSNRLSSLEYFQHDASLRYLSFADSSLKKIPFLEQVNLVSFNLSGNQITELSENFLFGVPNLRKLDLSRNNISVLSNPRWVQAENLNELDLSSNPIEVLTSESFAGLSNLKVLNVQNLNKLKRFDADTLSNCRLLYWLKIQTWPNIEKYRFRLPSVLANIRNLQKLSVMIVEEKLTDQLSGAFPPKLKFLEITGKNLSEVNGDALKGLRPARDMLVRITQTNITSFPAMFFHRFINMKATIDLRGNNLRRLGPEEFYKTPSALQTQGTQAYTGGIHYGDNYLECGCESSWIGQWTRRYIRENLNAHNKNVKYSQELYENALGLTCFNIRTGNNVKLLTYEEKDCYVSGSDIIKINLLLSFFIATIHFIKIY